MRTIPKPAAMPANRLPHHTCKHEFPDLIHYHAGMEPKPSPIERILLLLRRAFATRTRAALSLVLALSLAVFLAVDLFGGSSNNILSDELIFTTVRGDLRITVLESDNLESSKSIDIKGKTQILAIEAEGAFVRAGDVLADLDVSELVREEARQKLDFEKARAALITARKNHEIKVGDVQGEIAKAKLAVTLAEIDLEKYLKGDYVQKKQELETNIQVAREELKCANEKHQWSRRLEAKGFIMKQELEADRLAVVKRRLEIDLARRALTVFEKHTHEKEHKTFESNLEQAQKTLAQLRSRISLELALSQSEVKSKGAMAELEKERLEKLRDQIEKGRIRTPRDGLLVYNNPRGGQAPIQEGGTVWTRQTIFRLPDVTDRSPPSRSRNRPTSA
uniref:HlyD family secretion protein n=1 Tax=Candidatus Kentrum sp. TC TaxID=2126339 RepID=A0A450Z382_9GAMM|nr:MAG: hypothetical protein BECKTC1821E_GA0114239_110611 [Candidatus Kentron sp. TC]